MGVAQCCKSGKGKKIQGAKKKIGGQQRPEQDQKDQVEVVAVGLLCSLFLVYEFAWDLILLRNDLFDEKTAKHLGDCALFFFSFYNWI